MELWALIARFSQANELVGQLFRNVLNHRDLGLPEPDTGLSKEQMLEQLIDELDEVSISMVRDQYLRCVPLVDTAMRELESDSPDLQAIKDLRILTQDDLTTVSDILSLSTLDPFLRRYQKFFEQRDSIRNLLQTE